MYKLIIFDLDGTLCDTLHDIHSSLIHVLTLHNFKRLPAIEQSKLFIGNGLTDFIAKGVSFSGGSSNEGIVDEFVSHYTKNCVSSSILYPNIAETLQVLSIKGYKMAVLSNKAEHLVRIILDYFDLSKYFEYIAGGDTFVEKKPSPLPLLEISKIFKTDEVLMIGDSDNDINSGINANFDTAYCSYGYGKLTDIKPTYIIDKISKLQEIL